MASSTTTASSLTTPLPGSPARGLAAIAGAALLWSTGGLFIKLAPLSGPAVVLARSLVSAIFFLLVLRVDLRRARWSSALAYAGTVITFVLATKLTTAANAVFLQYTGPAYVLVLGPLLLGERFRRIDAVALLLSLGGMTVVFLGQLRAHPLGDSIAAASGVFYALTVLALRRDASRGGDALASTTLGSLLAAALMLPFATGELSALLTPPALAIAAYLGVVQMGLAYVLFTRGLATTSAASASLIATIEPVASPLWVLIGTGESPAPATLLGGAVVVGAIALRTFWPDRESAPRLSRSTPPGSMLDPCGTNCALSRDPG